MSEFDDSALDAAAGPGATAILHGMLHTLSEVLGRLDDRLGRLEARAVVPPPAVDVEHIAETVLDRLRQDGLVERTVGAAYAAVGHAVDGLRDELAQLRPGEPVEATVGRAVEAATDDLRHALEGLRRQGERQPEELAGLARTVDEALMALGDRNEAHAHAVAELVTQLGGELRRLGEGDDEPAGPDLAAVVAEAAQATERSLGRLHADVRGAVDELARAAAERHGEHAAALARLEHEVRAELAALRAEPEPAQAAGLERLEEGMERLRADLDERAAGQVALADRLHAELLARLDGAGADEAATAVLQAIDALRAEQRESLRRAVEEAFGSLAERQAASSTSLHQAVARLRADLAALAAGGDDEDEDEADAGARLAELVSQQAAAARDDLARIETVLRGQVAEVAGRADSMADVIGRLDGRLHEVVDGVRALARHLEATASLVPAVEALRAEVDEVRRLSEQPRLRAVKGRD